MLLVLHSLCVNATNNSQKAHYTHSAFHNNGHSSLLTFRAPDYPLRFLHIFWLSNISYNRITCQILQMGKKCSELDMKGAGFDI